MRELSGIQYIRALALIYSHGVPGFKETQIGFDPIQKRNLNPKRKVKTRLLVDRPVDRPMSTVDRTQPRAALCQSVDRAVDSSMPRSSGRSTGLTLCTSCTPVDRAIDRPSPLVDRAVDREITWPASMRRFSLLCLPISVLSSDVSSISSLPKQLTDRPHED